ncbi:putative peptide-O-fucosyltransferase [Lupinus albus]|uniref:O-fucosyltransferase family protein n=1 Tax=Lupinus albus TaxID=3870 RepID=A0A6A4QN12_LUPAL|nr:putative peptide-O-fucosyltransferase [Lupinus albus]
MQMDSASDEDDDRHNLIQQNERKKPRTPPSTTTTAAADTFHVEDYTSRSPRFNCKLQKSYIIAIVAIFFVLLFFLFLLADPRRTNLTSFRFDSHTDRMKESELRVIYLLRQQQLNLLTVWNHTFQSNASNSNLEDLKSAMFKQISVNREIQQVLLSAHKTGNTVEPEFDSGNPNLGDDISFDRCRTVNKSMTQRRTIEWNPKSDKFLLAICVSGQMSNHLICLEKHMFFAAVLNRVLVIPSSKVDYQYDGVIDIYHINKCVGKKVVISFEEFSNIKKDHLHIDKFLCYFSLPRPCYLDDERLKKLSSLGLSMSKPQPVWEEDIRKTKAKTVQDVLSKFTYDDDVMAIGDLFYAKVENEWVMQPGGPIAHKCKTLIEPSRLILLTAQRFIQTFLGRKFIALHFRRHGFLKFCNAKKPSCFYPIPQAADCLLRVIERADVPVIYLSTDAAESETGLLQSLVVLNGRPVPLVIRPARNSAEKWDALLYRHGIEEDPQVEAMLDKTISAMSSVFIGASGSTFTEDILRLRKDWGSASLCDEYLCQGEEPNVVAENE